MKTLHHKKNEKQEAEFFQDKECTIPFDFTNAEDLYVQGDIATLMDLFATYEVDCETNIYIPYLTTTWNELCLQDLFSSPVKTLDDITPNLSKYIPEDNAVLFLSEEDCNQQRNAVCNFRIKTLNQDFRNVLLFCDGIIQETNTGHINLHYTNTKKITIFIPHGTQAELQKVEEVAKELKEKYGVEEVNLFALHNFIKYDVLHYEILNIDESDYFNKTPEEAFEYIQNTLDSDDEDFVEKYIKEYDDEFREDFEKKKNDFFKSLLFNKIITTNSTGVLKPEDSNERLQVIDCKEIFEDFLNGKII